MGKRSSSASDLDTIMSHIICLLNRQLYPWFYLSLHQDSVVSSSYKHCKGLLCAVSYERQRIHIFSLFFFFPSEDPFLLQLLLEVIQSLKARATVSLRALNLVDKIQGKLAEIYKTSNKFIKCIYLTTFPNFYNWIVLDCSPQFWLKTCNINIQ